LGEQPTSRRAAVLCMLPTLFDVIGTVLNNIGLILTSVSVYQMLRGSVVLFTSLASRLLLKTRFTTKQLQGLVMVAIGVCFIGMANTAFSDKPYDPHYAPWPALGNVLILISQALMAGLFVSEETVMKAEKVPPMQMLGWEATLGATLTFSFMCVALVLPGDDAGHLENMVHASLQMVHSPTVLFSVLTMALALLCFNIAGVYITKLQSATHRACVDATRQAVVWIHALLVGWEEFSLMELCGYAILVLGTLSYNDIIALPEVPCPSLATRWPFKRLQKRSQYSTIG